MTDVITRRSDLIVLAGILEGRGLSSAAAPLREEIERLNEEIKQSNRTEGG